MSQAYDFVKTAEEKNAAGQSILLTEQTDAINSGIVGEKRSSISQARGSSASIHRATEPRAGEVLSDTGKEPFSASIQGTSFIKSQLKQIPSQKISNSVLSDTELEGIDDTYYAGKKNYRTVRQVKKYLDKRKAASPLSEMTKDDRTSSSVVKKGKSTLAQSNSKESTKKVASATKQNTQKQFKSYFQKNVYQRAALKSSTTAPAMKIGIDSAGNALVGKILAVLSPILLGIVFGLLALVLISAVFSSDTEEEEHGFGTLTGIQLEVAQALRDAGLDNIQIAAIMGNISGESGWNPTAEYHGQGNNTSYEYGYGLFQFTDTQQGVGNYTNFKNWADANGKAIDSATAQTEYFITQLPSSWATGLHTSGYYAAEIPQYEGKNTSYDSFLNSDDLGLATYAFLACYERPADWAAKNSYPTRFAEAQKFYAQLASSGGEELAASTEKQKVIVAAAKSTFSPGLNLCAKWVSLVYEKAGFGYIGGNANDMYRSFAHNPDRSQLKVGMVVAVESSSSGSDMGRTWGHVGIYIGDGMVMHNVGSIQTISLDDWISLFCKDHPVGFGFPSNVSP